MSAVAAARRRAVGLVAAALPGALMRAGQRRAGAAAALCYHTLGPDAGGPSAWTALRISDFARQVAFLKARYEIASLDDALEGGPARRPRAALTFDDGDAGLHAHLLPFLRRERIPVLVYVATAQIETGAPFWFDRVMNALAAPGAFAIDLREAGLGLRRFEAEEERARWRAVSDLLEALKSVDPARREALADAIAAQAPPGPPGPRLGPMTREQLAELAACPGVTVGAHSHGHELLDRIPLAEATASMARSRELLEAWTGLPVRHFAYPNGNWNAALAEAARRIGFASAAALGPVGGARLLSRESDRFALPRVAIGRYDGFDRFRLRLAGI